MFDFPMCGVLTATVVPQGNYHSWKDSVNIRPNIHGVPISGFPNLPFSGSEGQGQPPSANVIQKL